MPTSDNVREKFLKFFKEKKHAIIPSASLIPENDPTVLFTTAGMHPLVPFLLGEQHPSGKRLANFQKCVRTVDIDEVGDRWHLTFFEMLGNWSLGDYFKKEAIEWSHEFLTKKKWLGFDSERIHVSCFEGDKDAPKDAEAAKVWQSLGIPSERIHFYSKKENWWGPAGQTGPCGPDTEMFYDTKKISHKGECGPWCSCGRFVEVWNDVFMQYNKTAEGKFIPLKQKNVDTGMGLERVAAVIDGLDSVFETDLMVGAFNKVKELGNQKLVEKNMNSVRIITDHLRAAAFILGDEVGIVPSNVDQGYVVRRLIRRSIRHARLIGIEGHFTSEVAGEVVKRFQGIYPELRKSRERIFSELDREEAKFLNTIHKGLSLAQKEISALEKEAKTVFPTKAAFDLYQSFGFPIEMTEEIVREKGFKLNKEDFFKKLAEHQELSRKATEKKFKGGLADTQSKTVRMHTATHLLHAALRKVLGEHVEQKGSNITTERLRFDFSHPAKVPEEKLREVEALVNEKVREGLSVKMEVMSPQQAKKDGAIGLFASKYGEKVKVYTVFDQKTGKFFSKEICGGPHVNNTKEVGKFRIVKEEGISAGVRRIKAVVE